MNTKQTVILYTILGIITLSLAYSIYSATNMAEWTPDSTHNSVLLFVFICLIVMSLLFFVPVATGLVLLSRKK